MMNTSIKVSLATIFSGLLAIAGISAAGEMDRMVGDWKLNTSKSTYDPAPALKAMEMKVIDAGDGKYSFTTDWVDPDGTSSGLKFTTSPGNKPVPVTGYSAVDSVTVKKLNAATLKAVFTKDGKVIERETFTLSGDGKTLRDLDTGKDEHGPFKDLLVLERQ